MQRSLIAGVTLLLMRLAFAAEADAPTASSWKLTLGHYFYGSYAGDDLNLRWQRGDTHAWTGLYRDPAFGSQLRAGIDGVMSLGRYAQLQPSLQAATQGFVGGGLTLQAGNAWFGLAGIGRTNLRPYFNLNFDPNDAVTLGFCIATRPATSTPSMRSPTIACTRGSGTTTCWRGCRWPADGSPSMCCARTGLGDAGPVSGWGLSLTCDWPEMGPARRRGSAPELLAAECPAPCRGPALVAARAAVRCVHAAHSDRRGTGAGAAGLCWPWLSRLPLGRLPGDLLFERPGLRVYIPLATMLLVSLLISVVMWLFRR